MKDMLIYFACAAGIIGLLFLGALATVAIFT